MEFLIRAIMSQAQPTTPSLGQCPGIASKSLHQRWGNPQASSDPWQWVLMISHSSLGMTPAPKSFIPMNLCPNLSTQVLCWCTRIIFTKNNSHQRCLVSLHPPSGRNYLECIWTPNYIQATGILISGTDIWKDPYILISLIASFKFCHFILRMLLKCKLYSYICLST